MPAAPGKQASYQPVAGTIWRDTRGDHAGSTVKIMRATDLAVYFKRHGQQMGMSAKHRRSEGQFRLPRADFVALWEPASVKDQRRCLVDQHTTALAPAPQPVAAQEAPPHEEERVVINTSDTDSAGDQFTAQLAHKRCTKCGVDKLLGLFNRSRGARDGLQPECRECHKAYMKAYHDQQRQRRAEAPVLTTTDNHIIEQNAKPKPSTPVEPAAPAVRLKRWRIRALVYAEREFVVEATSYLAAAAEAERSGEQVEIIGINLEA